MKITIEVPEDFLERAIKIHRARERSEHIAKISQSFLQDLVEGVKQSKTFKDALHNDINRKSKKKRKGV